MSPPDGSTTLTLNHKAEEDRMRAALGLAPEPHTNRPTDRHHQKPGNVVPVTVLSTRRPPEALDDVRARLATLTDAVNAERSERVAAQQALADARQIIQQLQTKLAHAEIAAAEAFEAERKARLAAEARILELFTVAKSAVEQDGPRKRGRPRQTQPVAETRAESKRPGRSAGARKLVELPAQEPVQWWLPSYAAQAKRRRSKS